MFKQLQTTPQLLGGLKGRLLTLIGRPTASLSGCYNYQFIKESDL